MVSNPSDDHDQNNHLPYAAVTSDNESIRRARDDVEEGSEAEMSIMVCLCL